MQQAGLGIQSMHWKAVLTQFVEASVQQCRGEATAGQSNACTSEAALPLRGACPERGYH